MLNQLNMAFLLVVTKGAVFLQTFLFLKKSFHDTTGMKCR